VQAALASNQGGFGADVVEGVTEWLRETLKTGAGSQPRVKQQVRL